LAQAGLKFSLPLLTSWAWACLPTAAMAKYPWGDQAFSMPGMMVFVVVSGLLIGGLLGKAGPSAAVGDEFPTVSSLRGVALVTCAFVGSWYIFLGNQVGVKFTQGLSADVAAQAAMIADRGVYNALEQGFPFLALLWLHALFVNPETARLLGWVWVCARFLYPITYGMYGVFNLAVEFAMQPNYVINFYFLLAVVHKCWGGEDLHTKVDAVSPWLMPLIGLACGFIAIVFFLILAKPSTSIIINGVKKSKGEIDDEYEDVEDEE